MAKIKPLQKSRIFSSLSDRELALFSRIISEEEFARDTVLVARNMKSEKFFLVEKGRVSVEPVNPERHGTTVLTDGDTFGEWSILAPEHLTSVSMRVTETAKILVLKCEDFEKFAEDEPEIAFKVQKDLIRSAWRSMEEIRSVLTDDGEA